MLVFHAHCSIFHDWHELIIGNYSQPKYMLVNFLIHNVLIYIVITAF